MRRTVVPLALVLALLSGVVLAETRLLVLAPVVDPGGDPQVRANEALVGRFYAAVNDALATGDDASLAAVLATDFVDHDPRPGATDDRAGFLRAVQSLHAVDLALRLTVLDAMAQGDRVAVWVGIDGGEDGRFLGLAVRDAQLWSSVDVFRVRAGLVAEHWSESATLAGFDPILDVTVAIDQPTSKYLTLDRWVYAPNARETWATDFGFLVVLVETGTLTAALDPGSPAPAQLVPRGAAGTPSDERPVAPGEAATLQPGDALVVPRLDRFDLRNDATETAVALAVGATSPKPQPDLISATPGATEAAGNPHQHLAGGMAEHLPAGRLTVAIGRVVLAAGDELPAHRVDVADLVAVESGAMAVTVDGGAAWVTSDGAGTDRSNGGTVSAGSGVIVDERTGAGYGASGESPLGLLLVTVGASGADSTAATASSAS
jgi:predicted SnoaL-like aldol condensation-catalyzing enzyme